MKRSNRKQSRPPTTGLHVGLCALCLAFLTLAPVSARTLRVNNNSGILPVANLIFTNLADAVAAADNRDTIHIEGSVTPYTGDVTVDKRLVIIGPGYFLTTTAQTQYLKEPARMNGSITFATGSEGSTLAGIEQYAGASGYTVDPRPANYTGNRVIVNADTVRIVNCRLYFVQVENTYADAAKTLNNTTIQKCFFNPGLVVVTGSKTVSGLSITNSFFRNGYTATAAVARIVIDLRGAGSYPVQNVRISNNTFYYDFYVYARNSYIAGNAFAQAGTGNATVEANSTNSYTGNVMRWAVGGMSDGVSSNSVRELGFDQWFSRSGSNEAVDIYFTSATNQTGCPLRDPNNPTSDVAQRGMFGGGTPYIMSGMFKIPSVYDIVMDSEVGDQFDMTIRARVH